MKKLFILALVAVSSFIFSAYQDTDCDSYNPCYEGGTHAWDGYDCICRLGFKGLCCEIEMETESNPEITYFECHFRSMFNYKKKYIKCSMTIEGDAELEAKLKHFITVNGNGKGQLDVIFNNFAYDCIPGRCLDKCSSKDCSTALRELMYN